jgi:hypothetical protein
VPMKSAFAMKPGTIGSLVVADLAAPAFGTAVEEKAILDALSPEDADDRLDALLAAGWSVELTARSYVLRAPSGAPLGFPGGARRLQ